MYNRTLFALVLFATSQLLAQSHEGSVPAAKRATQELKRNDKYLELCGDPRSNNTGPIEKTKLDAGTLAAYDLLRAKCANCHNPQSTSGAKSFQDVLNVEELVSKGIVKAGNPKGSLLIEQIEEGSMPLGGSELTDDEKKTLRDWVSNGSKSFSTQSTDIPDVGFISNDDLEACMVKDLRQLPEEDKPFVRYLNLATLYNGGRRGEMERTRLALNKLLNSLSWKKEIKNPIEVDGTGTLIRLDLRDYKWTPEMWEALAKVNPYPEPIETARDRELSEKMKTQTPLLRGDWVVFSASKPPLYHSLLYDLPKLPVQMGKVNAEQNLEKMLHVDPVLNEKNGDLVAAGFRQSNVTKSNRIIKRHETPYGAYWESDDFKSRVGDQNIFEHPLDAKRDGGEFIYTLPNGLHGYLVADKNGTRLDGAPTEVVVDPLRFQTDGVVTPGVSCMSCHTKGIKKHDDETLAQFESLEALFKNNGSNPRLEKLVSDVKRIYKGNTILNQKYEQDEAAYSDAIQKTGNSTANPDPVHATAAQFEAPLDMRAMAAELGHTPEEVEGAINNNFELKQKLALGSQHTVDRTTFNANFKFMKRVLEKAKEPAGGNIPVSSDPSVDEHFEFVAVSPGTYQTRRGGRDYRGSWEEQSVTVTISKPFDIQTTEVTQSLWKKVMGHNPSQFVGDNRPVENVFKSEVQEFIRRLNETPEVKNSPFKYRLPTSDEWEYAARGANSPEANMESVFFFGNNRSEANDFGWFVDNSGGQTHDVGDPSKQPNALSLHDIHGNVKELVEDVLVDRLVMNIAKGGAFHSDPQRLDKNELILASENSKYDKRGVGFRLVRVPK